MLQPRTAIESPSIPTPGLKVLEKTYEEECTYVPEIMPWDLQHETLSTQIIPHTHTEFEPRTELPSTQETTFDNEKYLKRYQRLKGLSKFVLGLSLFAGAHGTAYATDVLKNMSESTSAKPSIRVMNDNFEGVDHSKATIFYHGFNTSGASDLVEWLGDGAKSAFSGEQWSVQYNNASLDANNIADAINEKIEERGITSIDVVMYSMGDAPGMDNAVDTINNSWKKVETINFFSSPDSYEGLTDSTKNELALAKSFAWIPWVEYSTPFRYLAEMYFYKDAIERDPVEAFNGINNRFRDNRYTTNSFLSSQINSISDVNISDKINSIDETKFQPTINYVKIKSNQDSVVNNEYSANKICGAAERKDINCNVFEVDSTHGNYYEDVDEYNRVFGEIGEIIKPQVRTEYARYAFKLHHLQQHEG